MAYRCRMCCCRGITQNAQAFVQLGVGHALFVKCLGQMGNAGRLIPDRSAIKQPLCAFGDPLHCSGDPPFKLNNVLHGTVRPFLCIKPCGCIRAFA